MPTVNMSPSTTNAPLFPTFLLPGFSRPFRRRTSTSRSKWPIVDSTANGGHSPVPSLSSSPTSTVSDSDPASPLDLHLPVSWQSNKVQPPHPPNLHRAHPDTIRCGTCASDLAFGAQIVSKGFTGRHGRAYLVSPPSSLSTTPSDLGLSPVPYGVSKRDAAGLDDTELLNIKIGSRENRQLVTGAHVVADISCVVCGTKVGWKYVQATELSQKYKEGKFILETARVVVYRAWEDGQDGTEIEGQGCENGNMERRKFYERRSVDSATADDNGEREYEEDPDQEVIFDSEDEDECEDIFAGTWDPAVVVKRRQKKVTKLRGKK